MTLMEDIHDIDHELELNNQKFKESEHVSDENKIAIQRFCDKCFADGLSKSRVRKYISNFHTILKKYAPEGFELTDSTRRDIERIVAQIEQSDDYAEATKSDFKVAIRKYYTLMEGDSGEPPEKADFFDTHRDRTQQDMPEILDRDEVDAIIEACKNDRDRAMYKVLYEAGLRAGELMALRIKDVNFVENGVKLNVRGKTGNRSVLVVESERYLKNWLSKHPFKENRNAALWTKVDVGNIDDKTPDDVTISYDYMRINLKRRAKSAGVRVTRTDSGSETSEVYPHLLRHTRATHLATDLTEAAMKQYFGWKQNSDMPKVYIHLSGRDVDNEIMRLYGIEEPDEPEQKECGRCGKEYQGRDSFCPGCGAPLDQTTAMKKQKAQETADVLAKAIMNGDIDREELIELAS